MMRQHLPLCLLLVLQSACDSSAFQAIVVANSDGTQIWSPSTNPHGARVAFGLPLYDDMRAARLSNGKAYFVGGFGNNDGTTYIFDPATNTTTPGAKLNVP